MTENSIIKVKCRSPHEFLASLIYSLSYASLRGGAPLPNSLIELGYFFTAIDTVEIYNMPAPDFMLINKAKKIALVIECKGDIVDEEKVKRKFTESTELLIRGVLDSLTEGKGSKFLVEYGLLIFDIHADYYVNIASRIRSPDGNKLFIWIVSARPQTMASTTGLGSSQLYTLRKYVTKDYSYEHADRELDERLSGGITVNEVDIICNPLMNPETDYPILFQEIAIYIFQLAIQRRYEKVRIAELVRRIKHDYQSPIKSSTIDRVIRDVIGVFPELGELQAGGIIKFKKRLQINIDEFHEVIERIASMDNRNARVYVTKIIREKQRRTR